MTVEHSKNLKFEIHPKSCRAINKNQSFSYWLAKHFERSKFEVSLKVSKHLEGSKFEVSP